MSLPCLSSSRGAATSSTEWRSRASLMTAISPCFVAAALCWLISPHSPCFTSLAAVLSLRRRGGAVVLRLSCACAASTTSARLWRAPTAAAWSASICRLNAAFMCPRPRPQPSPPPSPVDMSRDNG